MIEGPSVLVDFDVFMATHQLSSKGGVGPRTLYMVDAAGIIPA
jgi:hypothetical protein